MKTLYFIGFRDPLCIDEQENVQEVGYTYSGIRSVYLLKDDCKIIYKSSNESEQQVFEGKAGQIVFTFYGGDGVPNGLVVTDIPALKANIEYREAKNKENNYDFNLNDSPGMADCENC